MEWSFRVFWDFFGVCYNGKRDAQKNILFHVRFRGLRISKTPANAHEIKYFSELAVGCCDVWIGYVGGFYGLG